MPSCSSCGADNPERARFCMDCGTPFTADQVREVRKTVTVVFSDVVGSTGLGERLDPEELRNMMTRYYELANAVLTRHGARVGKFIGDAVMAVFGVPVVHEDDALRAVRAAAELHADLADRNAQLERDFGVQLHLRTGVNTGEILLAETFGAQDITIGDVVNVAARLEQLADPGEILLGDVTYRLVRDAVTAQMLAPLTVKGKGVPVEAWRLLAVKPGAAGHARLLDGPLVGREHELGLLLRAFERTVSDRTAHLVTLLGTAGAGKSRMLHELRTRAGGRAQLLRGRCPDYGEGMTYWPLTEVVRQAAGVTATDPAEIRQRIAALFPADEPAAVIDDLAALLGDVVPGAAVEDLQAALHRLLGTLAVRQPVIVVLDDLQWAETALLDLLESLTEWLRDIPVLLCCLARPELLEIRPNWGGGRVNATTLMLEPLTAEESGALLDNLLEHAPGATHARQRVIEAAGGNPLYLQELVGMLIEDGLLVRGPDGWMATTDMSRLDVPPSIAALLAARLDALPTGERAVLERASVIGPVFHRMAVMALTPPETRGQVIAYLLNLVRKELIRPEPSALPGESALHFRHPLLRDAAYRSLSKRERAELHERYADWLEQTPTERAADPDEVVGYHLEQACRYRTGFGPVDAGTARLAERAATHLIGSGSRAFACRDVPGAANLLARGIAMLPTDNPDRLAALPDLAAALVEMGEFGRAEAVLVEAVEAAEQRGDDTLRAAAVRVRSVLRLLVGPDPATAAAPDPHAAARTPDGQDAAALATGWTLLRDVRWLPRSAAAATPAGEEQRTAATAVVGDFTMMAVLGPTPVRAAIERYTEYLGQPQLNNTFTVRVLAALGGLSAMDGNFDDARRHLDQAMSILGQLGLRVRAVALSYLCGFVDLLADQPATAEERLRQACLDCERMGERYVLCALLALRAQACHALGRYVEAVQLGEAAEQNGPGCDALARVTARAARAKALARLDCGDEAEPLARDAAAMAAGTGLLNLAADALLDLAEVLEAIGHGEPAIQAADEALELYLRKGNVVSAQRTRTVLARLRPSGPDAVS